MTAVEQKLQRCGDCPGEVDANLLVALLDWRREQSERLRMPAYMILTTATVNAIAEVRPRTAAQMDRIPGIGPVKYEQFGADIIALVEAHSGSM